MIKTISFLALLFLTLCTQSQVNIDSLWSVWNDKTQADTSRLKAIDDIIWDGYMKSNPDSAFNLAGLQYDFAKSEGLKTYMAKSFTAQGDYWYKKRDYKKSLDCFNNSLKLFKEIDDKKGVAKSLSHLGNIYGRQDEYSKSIKAYAQSINLRKEINDKSPLAATLNNAARIYSTLGYNSRALDYFVQALKINEELGNKQWVANNLNNIGAIYNQEEDYENALKYFKESLEIKQELGNKRSISVTLSNIGNANTYLGNYSEALDYYNQSLKLYKELNNEIGLIRTNYNIGNNYFSQEDYDRSLEYFNQSLELSVKLNSKIGIAKLKNRIGIVYLMRNLNNKAIKWCTEGLNVSEEIGAIQEQIDACNCLYKVYKSLGKGNEALLFYERVKILEDSVNNEETAKKLQRMEFDKQVLADSLIQVEEKQKVQLAHEAEVRKKERTRNIVVVSALFLLVLAFGLYRRIVYVRRSKIAIEKEKDRSENLLLNILPAEIAEELKEKGRADARDFDMVSILFTDFKGFTGISEKLSAQELVTEINYCFEAFDNIMGKYDVEKIKTIGDAYMAAGGLPIPSDDSVRNTVLAALEMQEFISKRKEKQEALGKQAFEMRVGIHTGAVVAGIVGVKKFQYDIWGDTVNTASRIESAGDVNKVNISQATYELINNDDCLCFEKRGNIEVKGKGSLAMYFVDHMNKK